MYIPDQQGGTYHGSDILHLGGNILGTHEAHTVDIDGMNDIHWQAEFLNHTLIGNFLDFQALSGGLSGHFLQDFAYFEDQNGVRLQCPFLFWTLVAEM